MKQGVLRMDTRIHTGNMTFRIPEGTEVVVKQGVMEFEGMPFRCFKTGKHSEFWISVQGIKRKVRFPDGIENGNVPFPWLLL